MDYLKHNNLASAPALLVISQYLASQPGGAEEAKLRKALQPGGIKPDRSRPSQDSSNRDVLPASLSVGEDLGLLTVQGATRERRIWSLSDRVWDEVQSFSSADSRPFRALLLRHLGARAVDAVQAGKPPTDVAMALTWLLLQDPLAPFPTSWSDGPETAFRSAKLDTSVGSPEQWRAFMRWARSLGLATSMAIARQKAYLVVDPTAAIHDALSRMPPQAPADQWFGHLKALLPVLGDPKLVSELPTGNTSIPQVPASTALAVQKLEMARRLQLITSDDSRNTVTLRLGDRERSISEVLVLEEAA